jgi:CHRD domain
VRRGTTLALTTIGTAAIVGIGFAVGGLASSGSGTGTLASTSEETTETPHVTKFRSTLTAAAEVPRPSGVKVGAGGSFTLTVTEQGGKYSAAYKLTFRNLTGRAAAAHIHRGKPGRAGPVIVGLCGPCTSGRSGKKAITKAAALTIERGTAYVNVHTATNAAGEIRGQIRKRG